MSIKSFIQSTRSSLIKLEAHWLFTCTATFFGLIFIFTIPPLWGTDESAHFGKVYQIAHGQGQYQRPSSSPSGLLPENLVFLNSYSHADLSNNVDVAYNRKDVDDSNKLRSLLSENFSEKKVKASNVANYSPFSYPGPIAGGLVARILNLNIGNTIYISRIFSLVTYVCIVALAIYLVRAYKIKWFFTLIALLPTALSNGSMITADTILISLSILSTALFVRFLLSSDKAQSKKILVGLLVVLSIIPLTKVNYILFSIGFIIALPLKKVISRSIPIKVFFAVLVTLVTYIWFRFSSGISTSTDGALPAGVTSSADQLNFVIHHPLGFMGAVARSMQLLGDSYVISGSSVVGWNYISVPVSVSTLLLLLILITLIIGMKELSEYKKYLIIPAIFSLAGMMSVFLALYIVHTATGLAFVNGVQGRYFIPFAIPLMMLIASWVPIEVKKTSQQSVIIASFLTTIFITVGTLVLYVTATY